ncbi:hypothetical protein L6452_16791 [Arctium lappa]|uniref:Uncharacterized protein n=1 Tax=Arctium lappa TaxID=4217 RepID=A0ACB9C1S0_ARCLA|nr:hypothetical protein L6452_16791 [Arctium lappa]
MPQAEGGNHTRLSTVDSFVSTDPSTATAVLSPQSNQSWVSIVCLPISSDSSRHDMWHMHGSNSKAQSSKLCIAPLHFTMLYSPYLCALAPWYAPFSPAVPSSMVRRHPQNAPCHGSYQTPMFLPLQFRYHSAMMLYIHLQQSE